MLIARRAALKFALTAIPAAYVSTVFVSSAHAVDALPERGEDVARLLGVPGERAQVEAVEQCDQPARPFVVRIGLGDFGDAFLRERESTANGVLHQLGDIA